ncbi:Fc.00g105670.m01.CDS01 [Cosmosporella sp. VM-42]
MIYSGLYGATLAALIAGASARIQVHNWCGVPVNIMLSHNGSCDYGTNSKVCGSSPFVVNTNSVLGFDWIVDGAGTSMKISKPGVAGVLQFEYAVSDGIYWDLSDLDGDGPGLVGTPFGYDNVKVTPTGNGFGSGTCLKIHCRAGQTCLDSYQHPDDKNTRWCPKDTGDMWIDLCQPDPDFSTKRAARRHLHGHAARHISN